MKNIGIGKQIPTYDDLKKLASVLKVNGDDGYPGLDDYLSVLNEAVLLENEELVNYVCLTIADRLMNEAMAALN